MQNGWMTQDTQQGTNRPKTKPLTASQTRMLQDARTHRDPFYSRSGRSQHGGANGTIWSLRRQGLLATDGSITAVGEMALDAGRYVVIV
jgi:hypothetical protein